ncbi:hypothetical protein [Patulibacter sp. SYSU D01012]|uniref:hypothetical protein n=1 Tax=Patulibacter sp. SYSU D01012 TaxID=2817381 RepID=UPI001B30CBDC|nr:hypothetical protein [Patulibacter sp. SYSU D01012]
MALDPAQERPHTSDVPGFSDGVTFAFADPAANVQGTVRLGVADGTASGLIFVFADGAPVIAQAEGAVALDPVPDDYADVRAAGIAQTTVTPLREWRLTVESTAGTLDLTFVADGPAFAIGPDHDAAERLGMEGYEQPCRVRGTVRLTPPDGAPRELRVDGLGGRGHQWGAPDWSRLTLSRTVQGWFGDVAFHVSSVRPADARSHADEVAWSQVARSPALVAGPEEDGEPGPETATAPEAVEAPEPRISTTTGHDGRHGLATVELWESDEGPVWTATGEAIAGTTLSVGEMRLDMAFFRWRLQGLEGVGRYDILRKAAPPQG